MGPYKNHVTSRLLEAGRKASLGGQLTEDDRVWVQGYEAQMSDAERERWQFEREYAAM